MRKPDFEKIQRKFEENPTAFMAGAGALLMGVSKVIEATGNYRGSSAYAKDVARRVAQAKTQK
jgi:hypothetical protein